MGGGEIIALFVRDRLIDEYMVFVVPVPLGEDPAVPAGAHEDMTLKVIDVHRYNDGMVKLHTSAAPEPWRAAPSPVVASCAWLGVASVPIQVCPL